MGWGFLTSIVSRLEFGWGDPADRFEKPPMVEPVDPLEGGVLDLVDVPPGAAAPDDLRLVEPVDGLGESVVVGVADAADGSLDAGLREALGVSDRKVLDPSIAVMDQVGNMRPVVRVARPRAGGQVRW